MFVGRSAIWPKAVSPKGCATTATSRATSNPSALCQEPSSSSSATTVVKPVMSRPSAASNVVSTAATPVTSPGTAPSQRSLDSALLQEPLARFPATDVVVQTTRPETVCSQLPSVMPAARLATSPRSAQAAPPKRPVTTVTAPATFPETVQSTRPDHGYVQGAMFNLYVF